VAREQLEGRYWKVIRIWEHDLKPRIRSGRTKQQSDSAVPAFIAALRLALASLE
jgi:hypothetical protein